jgi:hypothetical protein
MAFEPNDYRKRVLAAVAARGGPQASDPFELYDLPLDDAERISDAAVAEQVAEVWAFWQRQRDHPKYGAVVAALVAGHAAASAELLDPRARAALAARVRGARAGREATRFDLLDGATAALVARHGGIPRDKLAGLERLGREAGLSDAEIATRLRYHRVVDRPTPSDPPAPEPGELVGEHRRGQIRALLDELGRIWGSAPPVTLLALLDCDPDAGPAEITARAGAWRSRARELPSDRLRTVLDELLVHVADLLESGPAMLDAYLDSVAVDVAERLRSRVGAAVLVEDRLTAEDHAHLVSEAVALGLDPGRSRRVLAELAAELGAPVDVADGRPAPRSGRPARPGSASRPGALTGSGSWAGSDSAAGPVESRRSPEWAATGRLWEEPLRAARAALRAGRPVEAEGLVADARRLAMPERQTAVEAVADEVSTVLADAALRWRGANAALEGRRFAEAVEHLERLERTAADVPDPRGGDLTSALARSRSAIAEAARLLGDANRLQADGGPEADRLALLLAALAACPEHPGVVAALAAVPVRAPGAVTALRLEDGSVEVVWAPSPAGDVQYRVGRLERDGTWRIVARTFGTAVTDGGAPPGTRLPVYEVVALQGGRSSPSSRSDARPAGPTAAAIPPPTGVSAVRASDGTVDVSWTGDGAEYRVSRLAPDGSWRVVGRTTGRHLCDGGAPAGPVPGYAVTARRGDAVSPPALSTGPAPPEQPAAAPDAASATQVDEPPPGGIPAVRDLAIDAVAGTLVFTWPAGVTEVMVVLRDTEPPGAPDDPAATAWKVTNTRYSLDGGVRLPPRPGSGPRHVAVASCRRADGRLVVAPGFAASARLILP